MNCLISCTIEDNVNYTDKLFPVLKSIQTDLRFCTDDSMLQDSDHQKVLIPKDMSICMEIIKLTIPHITLKYCCNVLGEKMPLFIVFPNLKKLLNDLKEHMDKGFAYLWSILSGW